MKQLIEDCRNQLIEKKLNNSKVKDALEEFIGDVSRTLRNEAEDGLDNFDLDRDEEKQYHIASADLINKMSDLGYKLLKRM